MAAVLASALAVLGPSRTGAADDAGATVVPPGGTAVPRPAAAPPAHVTPVDLEDVEHMCALLTSCERLPLPAGLVPKDFVACTKALYAELASPAAASFSLTLRDCGLRASSCGELRTCALRGASADACKGRGKVGPVDLCDAEGRAVTCSQERVALVRDCPRGGEQCAVRDGKAVCALGPCETEAASSCSPSGTRVVECKKGKLLSLDCGAFGLRCAPSAEGPQCATQGAPCTEDAQRCDGATSIACWHRHEVRVDCGARGLVCASGQAAGGGPAMAVVGACAVAKAGACDPAAPGTCDGATLRYCAFGQPRAYLCKSVGLSRCVEAATTGADPHDKRARCAP
ncbi:MAG: hypothetical protein JWP97_2674 [Labilithrix sp.]|nr:hypothetical protein [Labilithrix sp.]